MLALLEDLRTERKWRLLVRAFIEELSKSLPGKVRQVIALPSPEDRIYDSNVLVVLEEDTPESSLEVMRAVSRAEESLKVGGIISPLVVGPEDREAIKRFLSYKREEEVPWRLLVRAFIEELSKSLPGKVRQVIALPSPEDRIYDSNVLVVLEEDTPESSLEVMRAVSRAEESLKVGGIISPLVVGPEDREAIKRFKS